MRQRIHGIESMSKLGLTPEERAYAARVALIQPGNAHRLAFYTAALAPTFCFGIYGILRQDLVALEIGFGGLVLFVVWRIGFGLRYSALLHSMLAKVDAYERQPDA